MSSVELNFGNVPDVWLIEVFLWKATYGQVKTYHQLTGTSICIDIDRERRSDRLRLHTPEVVDSVRADVLVHLLREAGYKVEPPPGAIGECEIERRE